MLQTGLSLPLESGNQTTARVTHLRAFRVLRGYYLVLLALGSVD